MMNTYPANRRIPNTELPITRQQKMAIQIGRQQLHMSDEAYLDLLGGFGVDSCTKLTKQQGIAILQHMSKCGFKPTTKPHPRVKSDGKVVVMASPRQIALISHLVEEVKWVHRDGYSRWLHNNMGITGVRTREEASRVIEGLKGLKRHGANPT